MREYFRTHPWIRVLNWARYRCNNINFNQYADYGGRGIKCFLSPKDIERLWFRDGADKMRRPSIDRKDSNGNYEFTNCRFIELAENIAERNKRVDSRPVLQYSLSGELIRDWPSLRFVEEQLKYSHSHISKVCNFQRKQAYGYIWRFRDA